MNMGAVVQHRVVKSATTATAGKTKAAPQYGVDANSSPVDNRTTVLSSRVWEYVGPLEMTDRIFHALAPLK